MDRVNATGELEALPADLAAAGPPRLMLLPSGRGGESVDARESESAGHEGLDNSLNSIDDYT